MDLKLQVIHLPMSSIPTFESISSPPLKPPLPWCPSARQMGVIASLYNLSLPDSQPARQPPCLAIDGGHCVAADRLMNTSSSSPCPDACFHDPSLSTPTLEWQERKPVQLGQGLYGRSDAEKAISTTTKQAVLRAGERGPGWTATKTEVGISAHRR